MRKRYAVLGLSVVFALALAVPAFGGPTNPLASISATVKQTANKALKKAKAAQKTANEAKSLAGTANTGAGAALTEAQKGVADAATAQTSATNAQKAAEAAKKAAEAAEANAKTRLAGSEQRVGEPSAENTTASKFASASCPTGNPVLGGGFSVGGENNKVTVTQSEEQLYGGGWFVAAQTINGQGTPSWSITAIAICGTK